MTALSVMGLLPRRGRMTAGTITFDGRSLTALSEREYCALRGADLGVFVLRDVLERPLADTARAIGLDQRATRKRLENARSRVGLAGDAPGSDIAQWLVTELIAPPTRALQLHLFSGGHDAA